MSPYAVRPVSLQGEETWTHRHTQREDHVRTQGEGGRLQAKRRGLRRNQTCRCLALRLPASRTVRRSISDGQSPSLEFCRGSPSKLTLSAPERAVTFASSTTITRWRGRVKSAADPPVPGQGTPGPTAFTAQSDSESQRGAPHWCLD